MMSLSQRLQQADTHLSALRPTQTQEWSRVELHCGVGFKYVVTSAACHAGYCVLDIYHSVFIISVESRYLRKGLQL